MTRRRKILERMRRPGMAAGGVATGLALVSVIAAGAPGAGTGEALAATGGIGPNTRTGDWTGKARLVRGRAIPPANAPRRIVRIIRAANWIRNKPYKWGGGHSRWRDSGYDCSGAVSFVLRAARLLDRPLTSSGLMRWGQRGRGRWLKVFAHGGHTYAVIAGLRWDTSMTRGDGPGWSTEMRSPRGYAKRRWGRL